MLRLHYVARDHGSQISGHGGRNRGIVVQRSGTGTTNVLNASEQQQQQQQ